MCLFLLVHLPVFSSAFRCRAYVFSKFFVDLLMTVDGMCIGTGTILIKVSFFCANWTKETRSAILSARPLLEFN